MPRKKQPKQHATLFFPNRIKINDLQHDVANDYNGKIADINFFLLFHILSEPYLDLYGGLATEYMQIHSDILRCIFRDSYSSVIEALVKHEYLQVNESYSNYSHYCKSYRIHPKRVDLSKPFSFIREEVSGYFQRKLNTLKTVNISQVLADEARQHVIDQTANLMLVPDAEALQYVTEQYSKAGNCNPPETYFDYFNNCPLKKTGIDLFGKWLHSVITNMAKVLRRCLRFITAPTVPVIELDIVNSQPFFLSAVTGSLIAEFVPEASVALPIYKRWENEPDFILFRDLCRDGGIYEYLRDTYQAKHGAICEGDNKATRDFTKRLTYGVLFGDYEQKDAQQDRICKTWLAQVKQDFYQVYKEAFKSVYGLFKDVKGLYLECTVNKQGERKSYANNCLIAQRLESQVMFTRIVQALLDNGITEALTVHDCVIVRADEYEQVKAIAQYEFQQLNLNPKFN